MSSLEWSLSLSLVSHQISIRFHFQNNVEILIRKVKLKDLPRRHIIPGVIFPLKSRNQTMWI